jgi:hypothetical protein
MKRFFCLFILVYILSVNFTVNVNAQNDLVHPMYYFSHDQNMWGPDSAYGIDVEHTFFNVNINENYGFSQIESVFGQQFGVGVNMGIQALIKINFRSSWVLYR